MRSSLRPLLAALSLGFVVSVGAQAAPVQETPTGAKAPAKVSLFRSVRPEAAIVVTKHPLGADIVDVTIVRADYPLSDLKAACERVGELTGSAVRGLSVTTSNPSSPNAFPKASFATNGLVVDEDPQIRMAPLLRAFGYAKTPLKNLAIIYSGYVPNSTTMRRYADEAGTLRLEGQRLPNGVEYRTSLAGTLPESGVVLPGPKGSAMATTLVATPTKPSDPTLPIVLTVGALALGGLVYSLLLRPRSGAARRPKGR
ncbi:hypothetical protein EON81_18065 [bacterium]|nr:MAG: hypothetical protein EON81_18065 [bacterium]